MNYNDLSIETNFFLHLFLNYKKKIKNGIFGINFQDSDNLFQSVSIFLLTALYFNFYTIKIEIISSHTSQYPASIRKKKITRLARGVKV